jgi:hypothetical protein
MAPEWHPQHGAREHRCRHDIRPGRGECTAAHRGSCASRSEPRRALSERPSRPGS